jgi:hypothetical protein
LATVVASAIGVVAVTLGVAVGHATSNPTIVSVLLRDDGCSVAPARVRSSSVLFRLANRGQRSHTFTIVGRHIRLARGGRAVWRMDFPGSGQFPFSCSLDGHPPAKGELVVVSASAPSSPCGTASAPPTSGWQHVVWIVMENKSFAQVTNAAKAPFIASLAKRCGTAAAFTAEAHPSLPNYIAMTSGSAQGIKDDRDPSSHPLSVPSIFTQVGPNGWKALEEDMPSNCSQQSSDTYAVRHNPAAYYTNLALACARNDVPLGPTPNISARFTFITPNLCHDMHSCPTQSDSDSEVRTGDSWLASFMPKLLSTPQYRAGTTVVFLTWDEDDSSPANGNRIATLVIAPSVRPGTVSTAPFNHYSMLRTTEEILGIGTFLGSAAGAPSMRAAFHI